jgi:iron complex outermembrane receptor protein
MLPKFARLRRFAGAAAAVVAFGVPRSAWSDDADVTVHGSLAPRATLDSTAASSSVSGEALRAPGTTSADVLGRLPGVQVARTGSASDLATAAIRGATSAQTPVYLAGVRLNDDVTGTADLSTLPLFLVERVDVYRGNSPIDADRLGIGGAVLFEPRLPRKNELGGGFTVGSFGERSGFVTGGVGGPKAASLVAFGREGADNDFSFSGSNGVRGVRTNADYTATSAWALGRFRPSPGVRIVTVVHGYDREQGSPGLALVPDELARTESRRFLGAVTAHFPCSARREGEAEARCTVDAATSLLRASSTISDPLLEVVPSRFVSTEGDRVEENARLTYALNGAWRFSAGTVLAREHIRVGSEGAEGTDAVRFSVRPALVAALRPAEWTELDAVGSAEDHETTGSGGASASHTFEPGGRVGVRQRITNDLEMRANLGHYGRAATLGELHGVSASVHGNRALVPERGDTLDAGIRWTFSHAPLRFDVDLFGFARRASELIAYRQSGPSAVAPYNVGSARVLGVESALGVEVFRHLRDTLALTLSDPRDTTADRGERNDILPYRSRLVAVNSTELFTEEGIPALHLSRAVLGVRLTHRASKYADSAGLIVIDEQTVVDVEAALGFLGRALAARVALRNAFAAREFDAIGLPLPGRSVHFSLEGYFE